MSGPDFEHEELRARRGNIEALRDNLREASVLEKATSWAHKFGLEPKTVLHKLLTDDLFALHFVKDPIRQTFHQKLAADYVKALPLAQSFQALPSAGANAKFLTSTGEVRLGSAVKGSVKDLGKSIDFEWSFQLGAARLDVFATHKFTRQGGGNQDNQFSELKEFARKAAQSGAHDTYFFVLCDGPYYGGSYTEAGRVYGSRIQYFNAMKTQHSAFTACETGELPLLYATVIREWAQGRRLALDVTTVSQLAQLEKVC